MMKSCCHAWIYSNPPPIKQGKGTFTEIQKCSKCPQKFRLTFKQTEGLGDEGKSKYQVTGAQPI
jgi:hypothetical protein